MHTSQWKRESGRQVASLDFLRFKISHWPMSPPYSPCGHPHSPCRCPHVPAKQLVRRISHGMIRPPDSARALRGVYREMRLRYIFRNRSKSPQLNFWRHHPANPSPDPAVHTQESGNPFHPPPFRLILGKSGPNVKTHPKSQNNLFWEARVPKTMTCPGRLPTTSPRDMHI